MYFFTIDAVAFNPTYKINILRNISWLLECLPHSRVIWTNWTHSSTDTTTNAKEIDSLIEMLQAKSPQVHKDALAISKYGIIFEHNGNVFGIVTILFNISSKSVMWERWNFFC